MKNRHLSHLVPNKEFNVASFREDILGDKRITVVTPYEGAKIDKTSTISIEEYEGIVKAYQEVFEENKKLKEYIAVLQRNNTAKKKVRRKSTSNF